MNIKNLVTPESVSLLLCLISFRLFSQEVVEKKSSANEKWQKSYIVLNTKRGDTTYNYLKNRGTDTAYGYIKASVSSFGNVTRIIFRPHEGKNKGAVAFGVLYGDKDNVSSFVYNNKHYKYVEYIENGKHFLRLRDELTIWGEVIEKGPIVLSKGFYVVQSSQGGEITTPLYSLENGNQPLVLVFNRSLPIIGAKKYMTFEIDEKAKNNLLYCISDDIDLVQKLKNKTIQFGEIETIVSEYNKWAKRTTN